MYLRVTPVFYIYICYIHTYVHIRITALKNLRKDPGGVGGEEDISAINTGYVCIKLSPRKKKSIAQNLGKG